MNPPPSIYYWISDGCAWIRVVGKGNFLIATELKTVSKEILEKRGAIGFVIDLQECPLVDSTFSGTIAGVALRLRELGGKNTVRIVNAGEQIRNFFENLGLDQLFDCEWM